MNIKKLMNMFGFTKMLKFLIVLILVHLVLLVQEQK